MLRPYAKRLDGKARKIFHIQISGRATSNLYAGLIRIKNEVTITRIKVCQYYSASISSSHAVILMLTTNGHLSSFVDFVLLGEGCQISVHGMQVKQHEFVLGLKRLTGLE